MASKGARHSAWPAVLSLAQFRHQRLVSVVKPSWLISMGVKVAGLLKIIALLGKKGMADTAVGVASTAAHFVSLSFPMMVVWADRLEFLTPALATEHLVRSALCMYCATELGHSQFAESIEAVKRPLALHAELVAELFFGFQNQLSLPIMAVLHAIRQVAWMLILVWRMDATPLHGVIRGVCNWVVMMLVSWFWEMRTQAAYKRHCQQQLPALPYPAPALPASEEFVSHLPSADKPPAQACSSAQQASRMCSCPYPATSQHHAKPEAGSTFDLLVSGLSDCASTCTDGLLAPPGVRGLEHRRAVMHADTVQGSTPDRTSSKAAMQHKQDVSPTDQQSSGVHGARLQPPMVAPIEAHPSPELGHPFKALSHVIGQRPKQPYVRNRGRTVSTVCVKLDGIELDQMPAELPRLVHEQLSHCMPGVTMTGLALRSGCVMMTLDLASAEDDGGLVDTALAGRITGLISRLMQGQAMGQVLEDGATMGIQAAGELAFFRWDSSTSSYTSGSSVGSAVGAQELGLTSCRMLRAMPAVFCLPAAGVDQHPASYQLSLTVELQLPSICQLHGWQPGDVPAPSQSQPGHLLQDGLVVNAMLLARRLDGGYLPVMVERLSRGGTNNDDVISQTITAQVIIAVDGAMPGALRLELWCKALQTDSGSSTEAYASYQSSGSSPSVGLDLIIAYMPLLVLPGSWKEAAAELEQHIKDLGGVRPWHAVPALAQSATTSELGEREPSANSTADTATCDLLEDLGEWLAHHSQAAEHFSTGVPAAASDSEMSQLGNDLLVYAVQHGLGAVAGQIVDVMQHGEQETSGPSAWLVLATHGSGGAGDSTNMSLLHAAMAAGKADILAQVLRWGTLYGGPDWAWPWELKDATGCTALHLAAAQPAAGACAALLKTITCMLPAPQVQAARNAWLHCQGGFGTIPAELASNSGNTVGPDWLAIDQDPSPTGTLRRRPASNSTPLANAIECPPPGSSTAGTSVSNTTDTSIIHQAETTQVPLQPSARAQSWLGSMVEVWTTRETDEYHAWAKQQVAGVMCSWAAVMVSLSAVSSYRVVMAGCKLYDMSDLCLHGVGYIPLAAAISGYTWLGNWQAWMLAVHVFHCMAHLLKLALSKLRRGALISSMASGADIVYIVILTAVLDQTPLHKLLVARAVEAFCHGLANKVCSPFPNPFRRALLLHGLAFLVTTLARTRQLRAYRRWQAAQESHPHQANFQRLSKKE